MGQQDIGNTKETNMGLTKVESSMIEAVGYGKDVLTVKFRNGRTYKYMGVAKEVHDGLITAPSIGKYFNKHILDTYSYKEV